MVEWAGSDMSISTQADLLSLNRTSLYYQPVGVAAETVALRHRIDEVYTAHPYYGVRRITAHLQRAGLVVNHKAVARHMHEMGLAGVCPGPHLSQPHPGHTAYPYLLRAVTAAYPNHVWGIDITYIRLHGGWMYLVVVLDWFSRYVVSWALDSTLDIGFVLEAVRGALAQAVPVICNSDQGSAVSQCTGLPTFTSPQYLNLLLEAHVQISMDGRGRALDNIFTERLWRTVKYEEVYLNDYLTPRDTRTGLTRYFTFYNHHRPHQTLAFLTPAEVYFQKGVPSILNQPVWLS
jgi:putative transposase